MIKYISAAAFLIIAGVFCFQNCTKSNLQSENKVSQATVSKCAASQVTCTVANGSGTQTCTNASSGPVYGECVVDSCNSGFYMSGNQCKEKSFALSATGGSISMPASNFTAIVGESYILKISGESQEVELGLDNSKSFLEKESGICKGKKIYQPFSLDLSSGGPAFHFDENKWSYSKRMAALLGGCTWKLCATSKSGSESCLTIQANK